MIVAHGKGGFPRIVQVHLIPEHLECRYHDGGGGGPLLAHPVCQEVLVPAQDEVREFADLAGVSQHCLVELALAHHHLSDKVSHGGSGSAGDTKNCGGNNAEACGCTSRRRKH